MPKAILLIFLLAAFTTKAFAIEPILDQQAMIYFNVSFDEGHKKTSTYKYGFRFDRGLIKPGEAMEMSQLFTRPAVFNLGLNKYGIKAFELNGVNLTEEHYVYHAAEGENGTVSETTEENKKQTKSIGKYIDEAPTGVLIGVIIAVVALADSTSSN